ncbi:MAG: DUF309 domain-containing protein [Acidobacteriota bacterium]
MSANTPLHPEGFYRGLEYFNRGFYYECHDEWEEIWGDAKGKDKVFYQALIMAAVSLYHFGNENLEGALSCLQKSLGRFAELPGRYLGVNVAGFVGKMEEFYQGMSVSGTVLTPELLARPRPLLRLESDLEGESREGIKPG